MPKLRHLRIVNGQFNNGKAIYQDFRMPFYGYNATFELVNGGGKSVLLMLLLQCIIPNAALDPKKPFKDMFIGGDENRTTHVLAEWQLDSSISEDKYLLTGFCAKKRSSSDEDAGRDDIQYFNYIHLYNKGNEYDINNMPLCEWDGDDFSVRDYSKTWSLLKGLGSEFNIRVTDKKRQYQEWLKTYYLLESEWDLIKSINRRENNLKVHFGNFKTSRALLEELLISTIEECLQDRQRLNYAGDTELSGIKTLAEALYQSQEELKKLQKEQEIFHEYERLSSEVGTVIGINDRLMKSYQSYEEGKILAASQYKGYEEAIEKKTKEIAAIVEKIERLTSDSVAIERAIERIKLLIFNVKVNQSRNQRDRIGQERETLRRSLQDYEYKLAFARAANKYIDMRKLETAIRENEEILKKQKEERQNLFQILNPLGKALHSHYTQEIEQIQADIANEKEKFQDLKTDLGKCQEARGKLRGQIEDNSIQKGELEKRLSICEQRGKELDQRRNSFPQIVSSLFLEDDVTATREFIEELKQDSAKIADAIDTYKGDLSEGKRDEGILKEKLRSEVEYISLIQNNLEEFEKQKSDAFKVARSYGHDSIESCHIYLQNEREKLQEELASQKRNLTQLNQNLEIVETYGFLLSEEFVRSRNTLKQRYPSLQTGAEYLKELSEERRKEVLDYAPWLPKSIILIDQNFKEIVRNPNTLPTEIQDAEIILANLDPLRENRKLSLGDVFVPYRPVQHSLDVLTKDRTIERLKRQIAGVKSEISKIEGELQTSVHDIEILRRFLERYLPPFEFEKKSELSKRTEDKNEFENALNRVLEQINANEKGIIEAQAELEKERERTGLFEKKLELLVEIQKIEEETQRIRANLISISNKINDFENSLHDVGNRITQLSAQIQEKEEILRQKNDFLRELNREIKQYESYSGLDIAIPLYDYLEEILSEYRATKKVLDNTAGDVGRIEADIQRDRSDIGKYRVDIQDLNVALADIEAENPKQPYSEEYRKQLDQNIGDFRNQLERVNKSYENAEKDHTLLDSEFSRLMGEYNAKGSDAYRPDLTLTDTSDFDDELHKKEKELQGVAIEIGVFHREKAEKEREYGHFQKNHTEFRVLDGAHHFIEISAIASEGLKEYHIIKEQLDRSLQTVLKNKEHFNSAKEQLLHNIADITVAPSFKEVIKQKLRVAENYSEAESNQKHLNEYLSHISSKAEMSRKQVEALIEVEKKIVDQALGMAKIYRNHLQDFPSMSKLDIEGRQYEMIRINFDNCIYDDDRAMVEMRRYIQDLNKNIWNGNIKREELEKALRPNQLVKRIIDIGKIRVKIRKIDQDSHDYQMWDMIKASDGQENTMFIIFLIVLMSYIRDIVVGRHDKNTSKVLIIDNPFGSTGAYYLWEPIWSILERNNVQLICSGHKIGAKIREFFPVNHLLTREMSTSGRIRVNIKVEASGEARDIIERNQRNKLLQWI